jgi:hypothetical protein
MCTHAMLLKLEKQFVFGVLITKYAFSSYGQTLMSIKGNGELPSSIYH